MPRHFSASPALVVAAALAACSSDDSGSPSTLTVAKSATSSGDAQTGTAGQALANPLRVVGHRRRHGPEWRDGDMGHDQRRQSLACDEHHRRERHRGDDVDPRCRRWRPDGDGLRLGRERLSRHLHGRVAGRADDHGRPWWRTAVLAGHHHHQRGPVGAIRVGIEQPQCGARSGQSQRAAEAFPPCPTRRSRRPWRSRPLANSSSSAPCTRTTRRPVSPASACVAPSPSTDAGRNALMKYLVPFLTLLSAAPVAAQTACVAPSGLARGTDDGNQVGRDRVHADAGT